jgi:hypothetical protein
MFVLAGSSGTTNGSPLRSKRTASSLVVTVKGIAARRLLCSLLGILSFFDARLWLFRFRNRRGSTGSGFDPLTTTTFLLLLSLSLSIVLACA